MPAEVSGPRLVQRSSSRGSIEEGAGGEAEVGLEEEADGEASDEAEADLEEEADVEASDEAEGEVEASASIGEAEGRAGATWTKQEALMVMAKLHHIFKSPAAAKKSILKLNGAYDCTTGFDDEGPQPCDGKDGHDDGSGDADMPTAAKMLRLGFHDCVKYEDGSGGCDGCMRFHDQFRKYNDLASGNKRQLKRADALVNSNNGLGMTADALELIYTRKDWPPKTPKLSKSLQQLGKSRADLWAFAALVAADWAMAESNRGCRNEGVCGHVYNTLSDLPFACEMKPNRWLKFKTGRRDCPANTKPTPNKNGFVTTMDFELPKGHKYRAYETTNGEQQPNPSGNAQAIKAYFKEVFGFSAQETVAIMGAHALGEMHGTVSLFKYQWMFKQFKYLNNNYYRLLLNKPTNFVGSCDPFFATGGPGGAPATTSWAVRPIRKTVSAGPYLWFHLYKRCPSCYKDKKGAWVNVETEGSEKFRSTQCCSCHSQKAHQVADGCLADVARDETMLPADMAMVADFDVDQYGVPGGCPDFPSEWKRDNIVKQYTTSANYRLDFYKTVPNCPENTVRDGAGQKSMSEYVHMYADDQNKWVEDFYSALEKMLSNGYGNTLTDGPDVLGIERATCPGNKRRTDTCKV